MKQTGLIIIRKNGPYYIAEVKVNVGGYPAEYRFVSTSEEIFYRLLGTRKGEERAEESEVKAC